VHAPGKQHAVPAADAAVPELRRPRVSVLTPSFNQARWLGDTIRSVAAQDYPDVEHVVMDGGSTDGSQDLLAAAPSVATWRSEPDQGQSHAINKAFAASTGEIIGWLNSDDAYFDPHVISAVVAEFERSPDVDVVYGHAALVNGPGLVLHALWVPPFNARLLRRTNFIIQPAVFVRRSAAGDALVDEQFHLQMDREVWLRLLASGCRFRRIDRVLAIDRHWAGRKSNQRLDLAAVDLVELRRRYGVPPADAYDAVLMKLYTLTRRVAGARLVKPLASEPLAFDGRADGWPRLLQRQLLRKRATMPGD
jgi:glycosyltransferase involved in cell wall biosynthesis